MIVSLPRALSKLGHSSRSQAGKLIEAGAVSVNGRVQRDPRARVNLLRDRIEVAGEALEKPERVYLMLNKPRGLVTTMSDENGRETVMKCFAGAQLPRVFPVGRLDQASEGLLLFTNDTAWADHITSPSAHLPKTYHVQVSRIPDARELALLEEGVRERETGEILRCVSAGIIRTGTRNAWVEIVLDEGKNRQIRRMVAALEMEVLRLIRVAIGELKLGNLPKGAFRLLSGEEVARLRGSA